jgi:T4 superinfection immunity protein
MNGLSKNARENVQALCIALASLAALIILVRLSPHNYGAVLFAFGAYCAPTIVAVKRKVPNQGSVAVINILLGWTFIGWVVALAMAVRSVPTLAR